MFLKDSYLRDFNKLYLKSESLKKLQIIDVCVEDTLAEIKMLTLNNTLETIDFSYSKFYHIALILLFKIIKNAKKSKD